MSIANVISPEHTELNSAHLNVESIVIVKISREIARSLQIKYFYTANPCVNGHFSNRYVSDSKCVECISIRNKARYCPSRRKEWYSQYYPENSHKVKEYQNNNREHILKTKKKYREKNRDVINLSKRHWNQRNKHRIREYKSLKVAHIRRASAEYYKRNKDKITRRIKLYNEHNPMGCFVRSTIRRIERATGYDRICRAEKSLGYSQLDFIHHIESLFLDGMSWLNRSEWHIDHIKPISVFLSDGVTDIRVINALSNLRPLWAIDNLRKSNKWE